MLNKKILNWSGRLASDKELPVEHFESPACQRYINRAKDSSEASLNNSDASWSRMCGSVVCSIFVVWRKNPDKAVLEYRVGRISILSDGAIDTDIFIGDTCLAKPIHRAKGIANTIESSPENYGSSTSWIIHIR